MSSRASQYGIPGVEVDGNDVMAVFYATAEAVSRARKGAGPTLLECKTYRFRAHAEGMLDTGYRSQEEIEEWKRRDPIGHFQAWLLLTDNADQAELQEIDRQVDADVLDAFQFAESSPWPDPSSSRRHVFREAY